jgi:hypothetical protein
MSPNFTHGQKNFADKSNWTFFRKRGDAHNKKIYKGGSPRKLNKRDMRKLLRPAYEGKLTMPVNMIYVPKRESRTKVLKMRVLRSVDTPQTSKK